MKKVVLPALAILLVSGLACVRDTATGFPALKGPYLGQTPPGTSGALFALGFVSTGMRESTVAFSPDGKECYWTVLLTGMETILTSRLENDRWTDPEVAPFSGQYVDGWPAFRPDGQRMFFHSSRPLPEKGPGKMAQLNIWYMDRTASGWSEPRPVGPPINGEENAACPSATKDGTLYISKRFSDKSEKICRSALRDGKYQGLEVLPAVINTTNDNYHAFISPDESYLVKPLFSEKDSIGGGANYYVSFRRPDGGWTEFVNLGPGINSERCGASPSISADGKYIFFQAWTAPTITWARDRKLSLRELIDSDVRDANGYTFDVYWIESKIIEALRPKENK